MVKLLRVKDCFNYKSPKNTTIKNKGIMSSSAKVSYSEFSELITYVKNSINDVKNLLSINEYLFNEIIKALKDKGIKIKINPNISIKGAKISDD